MSKLYIVATPIGNLSDISLRALEVFKSVAAILCEDTRVTRKLMERHEIKKPLMAYHQHSKVNQVNRVIELIKQDKDLALVSDAGTPGIQDPGNELIRQIVGVGCDRPLQDDQSVEIIPVPGPSAVTTLLSVSGLPTDSFLFVGFLPKKKGRQKTLQEIVESTRTVVFYEAGHRIIKALEELRKVLRDPSLDLPLARGEGRQLVIGRELTKKFEKIYRGTVAEVVAELKKGSQKGEFVVAVAVSS